MRNPNFNARSFAVQEHGESSKKPMCFTSLDEEGKII